MSATKFMIILLLTTLLLDVGNARGLVSENCIFDLTCGHAGISCSVVMVTINAVAHVMPCYAMLCDVMPCFRCGSIQEVQPFPREFPAR